MMNAMENSLMLWPIEGLEGTTHLVGLGMMLAAFFVAAGMMLSLGGGSGSALARNLMATLCTAAALWAGERLGRHVLSGMAGGSSAVWALTGMALVSFVAAVPLMAALRKVSYWTALSAWGVGLIAAILVGLMTASVLVGYEGTTRMLENDRRSSEQAVESIQP